MRSLRRRFSLDMPRRSREPVTGHGRGSGASGPEAPYRDDLPASTGPPGWHISFLGGNMRSRLLIAGGAVALGFGLALTAVSVTAPTAAASPPAGTASSPLRIDVISRATAINNFVDIGPTAPSTGDLYVFSDDVFFTNNPATKVGR